MIQIKQIHQLQEELDKRVHINHVLESTDITTDVEWAFASDYFIPTQLAVKDFIEQNVGSAGVIGTPDDTTYTDGYFDYWTPTTTVANAADDINEVILQLLPDKPETLTNKDLIGPTTFQGRLSNNLINLSLWTANGINPGDIIPSVLSTSSITLTLSTLDNSKCFRAGSSKLYPADLTGKVYAWKENGTITYSTPNSSRDISSTTGGIGITGILEITDINIYNKFYVKVNAQIINDTLLEGYNQYKISADNEANETNTYSIYYVGSTFPNPSFSVSPASTDNSPQIIKLSGVSYYGANSTFNINYTADNLYSPIYALNNQSDISSVYFNTVNMNIAGTPNYNSQLAVSNQSVTLLANKSSNQSFGSGVVTLYKPNKTNVTGSFNIGNKPINTMGIVSTAVRELFFDENKRYTSHANQTWNSNNVFSNTEGQLEVQNGRLIDPRFSGNYPSYTSVVNYYRRYFAGRTVNIDKGTLTITKSGTLSNPTSWLNSGGGKLQISMWIQRTGVWTQYDLGTEIGLPDADGGVGLLDAGQSSNGVIKWALPLGQGYITPSDIVVIDIKFNNTVNTDYITELNMSWTW